MLDTQTKKKKRSQNNLLQTSLPLVWSAPVTQHMTAYCRCAMHKPSVLRVQMKGLRLRARPGGAAAASERSSGRTEWGRVGRLQWLRSPGTRLMSSTAAQREPPSLLKKHHSQTEQARESRADTREQNHSMQRGRCALGEQRYACFNMQAQTNKYSHGYMYREASKHSLHSLTLLLHGQLWQQERGWICITRLWKQDTHSHQSCSMDWKKDIMHTWVYEINVHRLGISSTVRMSIICDFQVYGAQTAYVWICMNSYWKSKSTNPEQATE